MNMKGSLPLLVLHILSLGPKHGYQIAKEIRQRSDNMLEFAEGTLYPTLHSMEKQGLLASYEEDKAGRTRRYYQLTSSGRGALAQERQEWQVFTQAVNMILGDA